MSGAGSIRIDNAGGALVFGNVGNNAAVGPNATVAVGNVDPSVAAALKSSIDEIAVRLAELAATQGLQVHQIELLAGDLKKVKEAVERQQPDEQSFQAAALDLWGKLMMISNGVQGLTGLAESLRTVASMLGWRLALPFT